MGIFGKQSQKDFDKEDDADRRTVSTFTRHARRRGWWIGGLALAAVILLAIFLPLGLTVFRHSKHVNATASTTNASPTSTAASSGTSSSSSSSATASPTDLPQVYNGTYYDTRKWLDLKDFNTTFTDEVVGDLPVMGLYSNYSDNTQANDLVPALDEKWEYGKMPIRGVNLGGWLVLEPFITPSLFNSSDIVDEWTLSESLRDRGGETQLQQVMETHYSTFVTRETFEQIRSAGLDHVRIPFGYWAVAQNDGDEYLGNISWRYLLRGIEYARENGLRVSLDLHAVPGSQNGWDHSGRRGPARWLNSSDPQGTQFGDQTIRIHKQLAKFFSQDRYKNIITFYGLVNEPLTSQLDTDTVIEWHQDAYRAVRYAGYNNSIIYGEGLMGPFFYHDKFPADKYPGLVLDLHQYLIFDKKLLALSHSAKMGMICHEWKGMLGAASNASLEGFGPILIGEWSLADTDCAKNLNFVGMGTRWEGTFQGAGLSHAVLTPNCAAAPNCSCDETRDMSKYSQQYRAFLRDYSRGQISAYESSGTWGWMYWTWKTESNPQWSYVDSYASGLLPQLNTTDTFQCQVGTDYAAAGLPESY